MELRAVEAVGLLKFGSLAWRASEQLFAKVLRTEQPSPAADWNPRSCGCPLSGNVVPASRGRACALAAPTSRETPCVHCLYRCIHPHRSHHSQFSNALNDNVNMKWLTPLVSPECWLRLSPTDHHVPCFLSHYFGQQCASDPFHCVAGRNRNDRKSAGGPFSNGGVGKLEICDGAPALVGVESLVR